MSIRRKNYGRDEHTREKIKAAQLLNRLQMFALGEPDPTRNGHPTEGQPVNMTPAQVKAAQILLNKVMPDLSQSEIIETVDDPKELFEKLKTLVGEDLALKLVGPQVAAKLHVN